MRAGDAIGMGRRCTLPETSTTPLALSGSPVKPTCSTIVHSKTPRKARNCQHVTLMSEAGCISMMLCVESGNNTAPPSWSHQVSGIPYLKRAAAFREEESTPDGYDQASLAPPSD
ncbi:hypothetical protein GCM10023237_00010 [Streptomyces coeruleoprunus]